MKKLKRNKDKQFLILVIIKMAEYREFPELLEMNCDEAKASIEAQFPELRVFICEEDGMFTMDYCEDRVRIFRNSENKVSSIPKTG
jgi:hypothetical protein